MYLTFFGGTAALLQTLANLAIYLLEAYAIYKLCRVRSLSNPFFAFIPFFQLYLFGCAGDSLKYRSRTIDSILGNIPLAYALPLISIIGSLVWGMGSLAYYVLKAAYVVVYYLIFDYYEPHNRILFTVLSVIPLVGPLLVLYSLRGYR